MENVVSQLLFGEYSRFFYASLAVDSQFLYHGAKIPLIV